MESSSSGLCMHACNVQPGRAGLKHLAFVHAPFGTEDPYHSIDALCMQTRGSDRSILLLNIVIRSYEVTWPLC